MHTPRKNLRYYTLGEAQINAVSKYKFIIKNLSITGCCLECSSGCEKLKINEKYKVHIKPERKSHIHEFELEVECRWIRNRNNLSEMGFEIYSFPKGKNFQSYVDYLSFCSTLTS